MAICTSERGYHLSELLSGLEKYIRRGIEDKALKCIQELHGFSFVEGGARIWKNAIYRIQVIFLEDIGLGNLALWPYMVEWIQILHEERTKPYEERDRSREIRVLERMIRHLCRSKKTRAASFMKILWRLSPEDTEKAKALGCATDYRIGMRLDVSDPWAQFIATIEICITDKKWEAILYLLEYIEVSEKKKAHLQPLEEMMYRYGLVDCATSWKKDLLHRKEGFLIYLIPLGEYLFGSEPIQTWDDTIQYDGVWPSDWNKADFVMDDFVNATNRTISTEFSKVNNEVVRTPPEWKVLYEYMRSK